MTDRPTDRVTDRQAHRREVALPLASCRFVNPVFNNFCSEMVSYNQLDSLGLIIPLCCRQSLYSGPNIYLFFSSNIFPYFLYVNSENKYIYMNWNRVVEKFATILPLVHSPKRVFNSRSLSFALLHFPLDAFINYFFYFVFCISIKY